MKPRLPLVALSLLMLAAPATAWYVPFDPNDVQAPAGTHAPSDEFIDLATNIVYRSTGGGLTAVGVSLPALGYMELNTVGQPGAYYDDEPYTCDNSITGPGAENDWVQPLCYDRDCASWNIRICHYIHLSVTGCHEVRIDMETSYFRQLPPIIALSADRCDDADPQAMVTWIAATVDDLPDDITGPGDGPRGVSEYLDFVADATTAVDGRFPYEPGCDVFGTAGIELVTSTLVVGGVPTPFPHTTTVAIC